MARVLIASDHQVVRAGLRVMLEGNDDFEVVGESALEAALEEADLNRADVLVLDIGREPDAEILWRLGAERAQVPVVAVGQSASDSLVRQTLEAGARAYLLWDAGPEELAGAIRAVLQGLVVLDPAASEALLSADLGRPNPAQPAEPLTPREREVLHLLAQGLPSKTIAARLRLSEHTVKFHIGSIMTKLGAASRTEAVTIALRRGLIAL